MCVHVHGHHALEIFDWRFEAAKGHIARIREEHVYGSLIALHLFYHVLDRRRIGNVDAKPRTTNARSHCLSAVPIKICHDYVLCTLFVIAKRERFSDSAGPAGYDGNSVR